MVPEGSSIEVIKMLNVFIEAGRRGCDRLRDKMFSYIVANASNVKELPVSDQLDDEDLVMITVAGAKAMSAQRKKAM